MLSASDLAVPVGTCTRVTEPDSANSISWQLIGADRRGHLREGLGDRRSRVLEENACQPSRQRDGQLGELFDLASGNFRDDDMLTTDIETSWAESLFER